MSWSLSAKYHWYRWSGRTSTKYSLVGMCHHNAIFVHIPKTGGVSINQALFYSMGGGHRSLSDYSKELTKEEYDRFFKFAIVRNPVDRLLSAANYLYAGGQSQSDRAWLSTTGAFPVDINELVLEFLHEWADDQLHFRPQVSFLLPDMPNLGLDYIGRYERIDMDFVHICEQLNSRASLPKFNASRSMKYHRDHLTKESMDHIENIYAKDFDLLEYTIHQ